jgi:hypothetical protein
LVERRRLFDPNVSPGRFPCCPEGRLPPHEGLTSPFGGLAREDNMARKPNYSFERQERERAEAKKAEAKAAAKAAKRAAKAAGLNKNDDEPSED